jgi:hypothetical protein
MKKAFLITFALTFLCLSASSQNKRELKRTFVDAEYRLLYEEYREALPLFLELYESGEKTPNINYRIGQCYLHIDGEKNKAKKYLEKATANLTNKYEVGYFEEKKAPIKALYYLGIAYRIDNQIKKAIETFESYKEKLSDEQKKELRLVNAQIEACETALKLRKTPTNILEQNLGKRINSSFSNTNAVVSGDEQRMVFVSELQFYDAIFYSEKRGKKWSTPRNISLDFESERPLKPVHLSYDGTILYLVRNDNNDYNIYTSKFKKNQWTPIEPFSENINSDAFEMHASTSKDGNILYFTSNREGGYGGFDIYRSIKDENGVWQKPVNLGEKINTPFDEATPFITENREKLYFSSKGHSNMGGFDIFYSKNNNGNWSKPVNMGFPINTTDNDIFFFPLNNGNIAYYSKVKETGYGKKDIYRVNLYERENIPKEEKKLETTDSNNK